MTSTRHEFEGRVAVVTGAGSGIGRASALAFAAAGASVTVADIDETSANETAAMISSSGGRSLPIRVDVTSPEDTERMVAATIDRFGRLDFALNNAGIVEGSVDKAADLSIERWRRVIDVNLTGVWLCMRAEIPAMLSGGGGAIVNTASVAGLTGMGGSSAYVASKHGVVGLTRSAALDYARSGIRINAVCPAAIRTPMLEASIATNPGNEAYFLDFEPVGRFGDPAEVAAAVLWLCSDASSFTTGHAFPVDGGATTGWR